MPRCKKSKAATLLRGMLLPVLILALWAIATTFWTIHPLFLPKLSDVINDFIHYLGTGELLSQTISSMRRCLIGFLAGSALGISMGILLGWYSKLHDYFDFVINFLRSIPKTALAPFFIVWFGFGDLPKVLLVGLGAFFYTLIPTIEGVKNVDSLYIKSARSMGATDGRILGTIILPAAMPSMYAGLRIAAATSLVILVFVEILAGDNGLGYMLEQARASLNMTTMFMDLIVLGVIGYSIDRFVRFTEAKLMPWRKGKTISV